MMSGKAAKNAPKPEEKRKSRCGKTEVKVKFYGVRRKITIGFYAGNISGPGFFIFGCDTVGRDGGFLPGEGPSTGEGNNIPPHALLSGEGSSARSEEGSDRGDCRWCFSLPRRPEAGRSERRLSGPPALRTAPHEQAPISIRHVGVCRQSTRRPGFRLKACRNDEGCGGMTKVEWRNDGGCMPE